jgi:selenocysteine lyase/cysteine desulfurase
VLTCQKNLFSLPEDLSYVNCAYMSPLPDKTLAAGVAGLQRKINPSTITSEDFFSGTDRVRERFARLINAEHASDIAIIPAVSYAVGIVARNLDISRHQNVVTFDKQFPSNMYPWRRLCTDAGAELRVVASPKPTGTEGRAADWNQEILNAIDESTALVALANVHWTDGTLFDLESIGQRAREVGALFVVDGTQSVGALPFDVQKIQADLVAVAGYKWLLAPYSVGAAYVGSRLQDAIPLEETWMGRKGSRKFGGLVDYEDRYRPGASRHDVGEAANFALMPMLEASLDLLLDWGTEQIAEYCGELTKQTGERLRDAGYGLDPFEDRAPHLFGVRFPEGVDPTEIEKKLAAQKVVVSVRGAAVRVSPNVYNDEQDLQRLEKILLEG